MKLLKCALLALFVIPLAASALEMVVTVPFTSDADVAWLVNRGYGVDMVNREVVRMVLTPEQLADLRASGHLATVEIADLAKHERAIMGWDNPNPNSPAGYDTYDDVVNIITGLADNHSDICQLKELGTSVNGNMVYGLKISKNVAVEEFEPELRLVAAHHGNEAISTEVMLYWTRDLLDNYGSNPDFTYIVDHYELWFVPIVNPDGYISTVRTNAHGVDLNRNYSYMWSGGGSSAFSEPETQHMRDFSIWDGPTDTNTFVASLTGHSGEACCNTVWNYPDGSHPSGSYHATPDDALVMTWGHTYTDVCTQPGFYLTNGCDWYGTNGDMNDWSYGERGDMDYTIEYYGPSYNPPASGIQTIYDYHKQSTTDFFRDVDKYGIYGRVARTDAKGVAPIKATMRVTGDGYDGWDTYNDPTTWGDYYRPLMPGTYSITCTPDGFDPVTVDNVTVNEGTRTRLDFCFPYTTGVDVTSFTADPGTRGMMVRWSVTGEASAVSYNLYRRAAGTSKDKLRGFEKLNSSPITGGTSLSFVDTAVQSGTRYEYSLGILDSAGVEVHHGPILSGSGTTKLAFRLYGNAPNPFASTTALRFDISDDSRTSLRVYDLTGRLIRSIDAGQLSAGSHSLNWDGTDSAGRSCANGVYTAVLEAGNERASVKMIKVSR